MTRNEGKNFFNLIIKANGKPDEKKLQEYFPSDFKELVRRLYLADFAVYTNEQLVNMAKKALSKM